MTEKTVLRERSKGMPTITLAGKKITLSPFCVYKFQEGCNLLAEMIEECGVQEIMEALVTAAGLSPAHQAVAFAPILPKALRKLPDSVCAFVALCCIPNKKLMELYDTEGAIEAEAKAQAKTILFECEAPEIVAAMATFLEMLRIEDLGNELRGAFRAFGQVMGAQAEEQAG